jgi:hypothetical protein
MDGARAGAPHAPQGADRLHRRQNRAEARDQGFSAQGLARKAVSPARSRPPVVQPDGQTAVPVPPRMPTPQAQTRAAQRRSRRRATAAPVWARPRQGWSPRAMAQPRGSGRMPVVRSLQAATVPERTGQTTPGTSIRPPATERLLKRWHAGGREACQRFRALRRHGDPGSDPPVAREAQRLRQAQGLPPREARSGQTLPRVIEVQPRPLPTRRATRLVLKRPRPRTHAATPLLAPRQSPHRDLAVASARAGLLCPRARASGRRWRSWGGPCAGEWRGPLAALGQRPTRGRQRRERRPQAALEPWPGRRPHQPPEEAHAPDVWARHARPAVPAVPAGGVTRLGAMGGTRRGDAITSAARRYCRCQFWPWPSPGTRGASAGLATATWPASCRFCRCAAMVSRRVGAPSPHEGAVAQVRDEEPGVPAWRGGRRHEDADDLRLRVEGTARAATTGPHRVACRVG